MKILSTILSSEVIDIRKSLLICFKYNVYVNYLLKQYDKYVLFVSGGSYRNNFSSYQYRSFLMVVTAHLRVIP